MESLTFPHSPEAERHVIGACLISAGAINVVSEILGEDDFYGQTNVLAFRALQRLRAKGIPADIVTLCEELHGLGVLDDIGGAYVVSGYTSEVPSAANVGEYARIVKEYAYRRKGKKIMLEMMHRCDDRSEDIFDTISAAQTRIASVTRGVGNSSLFDAKKLVSAVFTRANEIATAGTHIIGVPSGLSALDYLTGGFRDGELTVIGARPSVGKTALALSMMYNQAALGIPTALFSVEMTAEEVGMRFLSHQAGYDAVGADYLRGVNFTAFTNDLTGHCAALQSLPLFVDDKGDLTQPEFAMRARRYVEDFGVRCIFVDYLQLLRPHEKYQIDKRLFIGEVTKTLKATAKKLGVPVVALSQLGRRVESRPDKLPEMSDLMESGDIEADADRIILIHRPERYEIEAFPDGTPTRGKAVLILAKNRNGKVAPVRVSYRGETMRFVDEEINFSRVQELGAYAPEYDNTSF